MTNSTAFWPPAQDLQHQSIGFTFRGHHFEGHRVAPSASVGPRPLVLVIHNYQGLKQFDRDVAEYFARLGYVGLAIDMYGDRVPSDEREFPTDPRRVEAFQTKCFEAMVWLDHDPELFRALLEAWINAGKAEACVNDAVAPAAIGYCFGGMAVLEGVRGGLDLSAVVSFHGLLQTGEDPSPARFGAVRPPLKPIPNDYNTETIVLIENGAEDHLVLQAHKDRFFAEMDGAGVDWCFVDHAKTPHGFALPSRIGPPGHLHEGADRRSTQNMLSLLREVFPDVEQAKVDRNAAGTKIP
ncbi:MAG: dienelactone hydrolase family protein [Gammaproteobacteria bacterium]|nr:dienelactone hydrolase family protein [Gammaproteobacteria bacterium]